MLKVLDQVYAESRFDKRRPQPELKRNETIPLDIGRRIAVGCSSYAAPRVISVGLFVQSAFGANTIYNLFSRDLHALRNVVIRDRVPYEQGIHVFAQPLWAQPDLPAILWL